MMVIRPRTVQEIVDAVTLARGAHRSLCVGDGTSDAMRMGDAFPVVDSVLDITALSRLNPIDTASRLVEVELGIRAGRLVDELARAGFTAGEPVGPPSRLLYFYVADTPDLWRSPRALTLRERVVSVRGVLPDGSVFATRDAPRAANGPLVDRLLVGGAPRLVPVILTHATIRLDSKPHSGAAKRRAFRLPSIDLVMRLARRAWPHTVEMMADMGASDVTVILEGDLPDFPECDVPTFAVTDDAVIHHRRALWADGASVPRRFWAYRVDRWGFDAVWGGDATTGRDAVRFVDRALLAALDADCVFGRQNPNPEH